MSWIQKYFFLITFGLALSQADAQSYKFKASEFSELSKLNKGQWGEWSELQKLNALTLLDTDKSRIVIYTQEIQLYNILEYLETEETDTDIVYSFICKSNDGINCKISIITRKMQNHRKQLYITFDDSIKVYNISNLH